MQKYTPKSKDENHKTPEIIRWHGYKALDDNKGKATVYKEKINQIMLGYGNDSDTVTTTNRC